MKKGMILLLMVLVLIQPVSAMEFYAPPVPEQGQPYMPAETETFAEGLWYVIRAAIGKLRPELAEAAGACMGLIAVVLLTSLLKGFADTPGKVTELIAALSVSALLLGPSRNMLRAGVETVGELSAYGKLLLPVMTGALAAQGGITASAALYTGSAFFLAVLSSLVSGIAVPLLWMYLCLCVANHIIGQKLLKDLQAFLKWLMTWTMKLTLYFFTGYMGITGIVSGTADAAAVKATKIAISGAVPVVGGILSDASEAVLVGAGVMKSAAGVYGLLATLSVCVGPFLKIGARYLLLKVTAGICGVFGTKEPVSLIKDFSGVMGFVLAMTGTVCLLLMISIVCFMKELS